MFIKRNIPLAVILRFAWKYLLFFIAWSGLWVFLHDIMHHHNIHILIPFAPVSTIGTAVAFYLGFKNNQSYDRFWEARTIWGGIVNSSRIWGNQVLSYISVHHQKLQHDTVAISEVHKRLIYRQLAYINALRLNLRKPTTFSQNYVGAVKGFHFGSPERSDWEEQVKPFLSLEEYEILSHAQNMPTQILRRQSEDLQLIFEKNGLVEDLKHIEMMNTIRDLFQDQGRTERIKNTPFPRQYAYFSKIFTWIFIILLPLALINEFDKLGHGYLWLTVPFSTIISWIFMTMELVGDNSEDPFENFINDVPMTALCRNIEIDLREMLGEVNLPPRILPVDGILM
jgi:ion channel-forming bestrophin family protein